jgi:hypothetical protein
MAYVPNYEYDVFVSYAHVDDQPEPGEEKGWVTTLVSSLKTKLAQKLGRNDAFSLWKDDELSGHAAITRQITSAVERAATLVVVLSPGYVASEWCQREAGIFLRHIADRRTADSLQIFIVHRDKVDEEEQPDEFKQVKGYKFWVQSDGGRAPYILGTPRPSASDLRYHEKLNDLATELAEHLRLLRNQAHHGDGKKDPDRRPTIFLAEPTDDLDEVHDDLKRYLQQAGLRVLPEGWYPRAPDAFRDAAARDLASSELFAQLLSGSPGKRTSDVPQGYAHLQLDLAARAGRPIIQWRSTDLDLRKVANPQHRTLLEAETVLAVPIEEFKRTIKERVARKVAATRSKSIDAFVFVDTEAEDLSLAEQVCETLRRHGAGYVLPEWRGTAGDMRGELERNLVDCDALIVVYGSSDRGWVDEQLRQCRKILSKRERPLQVVAVYEGPPEPKQRLNVNLPKMLTIDCRQGLDESALTAFLTGLAV